MTTKQKAFAAIIATVLLILTYSAGRAHRHVPSMQDLRDLYPQYLTIDSAMWNSGQGFYRSADVMSSRIGSNRAYPGPAAGKDAKESIHIRGTINGQSFIAYLRVNEDDRSSVSQEVRKVPAE